MQRRTIQRIIGVLLTIFSLTMLPPVVVAWLYDEATIEIFLATFAATLSVGAFLWIPVRSHKLDLRLRDGFIVVVMFWVVLSAFGAIPFVYNPGLTIIDAVFESLSGLQKN